MTNLRYRSYVQLRQSIDQLYHQQAVRLGLPDSVLWLVVSLCGRGQACTPTELYTDCAMSKQTGHSALQWLEKRELIRLIPDDTDRRSKRAELTAAGQELADRCARSILEAEAGAFETLKTAEQETLLMLTEKIYLALKTEMDRLFPSGKGTI